MPLIMFILALVAGPPVCDTPDHAPATDPPVITMPLRTLASPLVVPDLPASPTSRDGPDPHGAVEATPGRIIEGFEPLPPGPIVAPRYQHEPTSFVLALTRRTTTVRNPFFFPARPVRTSAPDAFVSACGDRWCIESRELINPKNPQYWERLRVVAAGHAFRVGLATEAAYRSATTTTFRDESFRTDLSHRIRWVTLGIDLGLEAYALPEPRLTVFSGYVENTHTLSVSTGSFTRQERLAMEDAWFMGGRLTSGIAFAHRRVRFDGSVTYIQLRPPAQVYLPRREWSHTFSGRVRFWHGFWVEGSLSFVSGDNPVMTEPSRTVTLRWQSR